MDGGIEGEKGFKVGFGGNVRKVLFLWTTFYDPIFELGGDFIMEVVFCRVGTRDEVNLVILGGGGVEKGKEFIDINTTRFAIDADDSFGGRVDDTVEKSAYSTHTHTKKYTRAVLSCNFFNEQMNVFMSVGRMRKQIFNP